MIQDHVNDKLFVRVCRKQKVSFTEAKRIIESQFRYIHKTMKQDNMPPIKLDYLGKFHVHPLRKKYLQDKLKNK